MAGEPSDEADAAAGDGDLAALRIAREEARATLDAQLSTLDDVDEKALSVFRLNVAVVGALLSALSVAAASDVAAATALANPVVGAGVGLFVLSAAAAGLTYTAGGQRVGPAPDGLTRATDLSERAYLAALLAGYGEWLRHNERTNARKALLVTLAILGTVAGALALGAGVVAAFTGEYVWPVVAAVIALAAFAAVAGLPGQVGRLIGDRDADSGTVAPESLGARLPGQRAYQGRDRED